MDLNALMFVSSQPTTSECWDEHLTRKCTLTETKVKQFVAYYDFAPRKNKYCSVKMCYFKHFRFQSERGVDEQIIVTHCCTVPSVFSIYQGFASSEAKNARDALKFYI